MAKFHYDLTGAEPIVRDMSVYDAATLVKGEFVVKDSTDPDDNFRLVSSEVMSNLTLAAGIMNETLTTVSLADIGDTTTTAATSTTAAISSVAASGATTAYSGFTRYGKVIINPFAVYLTEYSQAAADDLALTQAWNSTTLTLASLEDSCDGGWFLGASASTTSGFAGQLRHNDRAASGSATVSAAPTVAGAVGDTLVKIIPVNKILLDLNDAATMIQSQAAVASESAATIVENYISAKDRPLEPLKVGTHVHGRGSTTAGVLDLGDGAKAYADLLLHSHMYNPL